MGDKMYCTNCGESISQKAEICPKCGIRPFHNKEYCYNCGVKVKEKQEICVQCGVSLNRNESIAVKDAKDPVLMAVISFFFPGLGQILMGQVKKGAVILLGSIFFSFLTHGFSFILVSILAVVDAYLIGKKLKEGKQVGEWEFF